MKTEHWYAGEVKSLEFYELRVKKRLECRQCFEVGFLSRTRGAVTEAEVPHYGRFPRPDS